MTDRQSQRFDRLNESNYATWSIYAAANLKRKGLWSIVKGHDLCPTGSVNNKTVRAWARRAEEACSEIVLSVEPSQLPHCTTEDPVEMWEALRKVHRAHGLSSLLAVRRRFLFQRKLANQTMQQWVSEVRASAFELEAVEATVTEEDCILVLTQGLPKSYDAIVAALDTTQPDDLSLDYVIERLLGAEAQIEFRKTRPNDDSSTDDNNVALTARPRRPLEQITCFECDELGHYARDCPKKKKSVATLAVVSDKRFVW